MTDPCDKSVVIVGAGPAGLTAAYELSSHGVPCLVLEQDDVVGGLARTVQSKGYRFDIGGHRFFSKVDLINRIWKETLGEDLLLRPRLSRIVYRSHFFHYPLRPWDALRGLGLREAIHCMASYGAARLRPRRPVASLEDWLTDRFGSRLYRIFFQTYTEKVWGIPCRSIGAEWAAQRIQGLSVSSILRHLLLPNRNNGGNGVVKTLVNEFLYPRLGPGMMWERMRDIVVSRGVKVLMSRKVDRIDWGAGGVTSVTAGGETFPATHMLSTMPIREMIQCLAPDPPEYLRNAAADFSYRDFLTVALIVKGGDLFPDNWIYVHDSSVRVGRIQNYSNWSPDMVPDPGTSCLGLEYFCFEGDGLWRMRDEELIALAKREAGQLGLIDPSAVIRGEVVRMKKAYPVYDGVYTRGLRAVRQFLETVPNLQLVGRNGMHRYNNQDHSMLTGILAAQNILGAHHDIWSVNTDPDYHEDGMQVDEKEARDLQSTQPLAPTQL